MAEVTVRNVSNFEPDVGAPTLLAIGDIATVERTEQVDDYINTGALIEVEPEPTIDELNVDELKEIAKQMGLPVGGNRSELLERIKEHDTAVGGDS